MLEGHGSGEAYEDDVPQNQESMHFSGDLREGSRAFQVIPETMGEEQGWAVRIEGIPAPSIAHDHPWPTVEAARAAAERAIEAILELERMQREEMERHRT